MKKLVCLSLVLVLCLCAFGCLAEDTANVENTFPNIVIPSPTRPSYRVQGADFAALDAETLAALESGELNDELKAAFGETDQSVAAYEAFAISEPAGTEGETTVVFRLPTTFAPEQKVVVVLKLAAGMTGYPAEADGNVVTVTFDAAAVAEMTQGPVPCFILATVTE